ncbi:MAG: class I SAM-dependent methyltransferase [Desulfosarcinaceae bacterium]|nr:class I SAM-dependent methyltransferase [Desulfosarcinaceae bacterium]
MPDPQVDAKFRHQAEMLANRVKKRFKHLRKRFARRQIDIFRLYDWDIPEIRAVVDWYGGHLVVGEYTRRQSVPEWLPLMGAAVGAALAVPPHQVHLKQRRAGKQAGRRYTRLGHTDRNIVLRERDLKFLINPYDYVDTGLFADHRDTRQMVRELAAGKDVLNLYCYTGAFTCYAAKGGARSSVSVDRSETAIQWARENFALNDISPRDHRLVQQHSFDYLRRAGKAGGTFDLAVVDPPSFSTSRSRGQSFDIQRDHPRLLKQVAARMRPGGLIFFSTNHQQFVPAMTELPVATIEEITDRTLPEDYRATRRVVHRCWRIAV